MAAAASSASKKKTTKTAATKPRAQRARSKPPKLSPRDVFWRRVLQWLALGLSIFGAVTLLVAMVAYVVGIAVSSPLTALTLEVEHIWFLAHNFSLDLFQVLIERKLFFWLPNPTDPWFNVVRPILFQTPLTLAAVGAVSFGFGWGIGRIVRLP